VATTVEREGKSNFIRVSHGKMIINVPLRIFKDQSSVIDQSKVDEFREKLAVRYPWLSHDALEMILNEARRVRAEQVEKERTPIQRGRDLISSRRYSEAIRLLERHLESHPEDGDAWQLKGEALCRIGKIEEGFHAISIGRKTSSKTQIR